MTSISYNLSGKINPILVNILRIIQQETAARGMLFFIVGATARDLLLHHGHNIPIGRGTLDLDIGVEVDGWEKFQQLKEALVATGRFSETEEPQRLLYGRFFVDLVPYGVSPDARKITWPPDHMVMMNIMGFKEAYAYGVTVRLSDEPPLDVRVPTIAGMALMKIISWSDSYPLRSKDAEDLRFLMENYAEAGNIDRLFDDEPRMLEEEGFDVTMAGLRLLGRDMAAIAEKATGEMVSAILQQETDERQRCRLIINMERFDGFDETLIKLKKLAQGFHERFQAGDSA